MYRFHAWQSALLFTILFVRLIFIYVSSLCHSWHVDLSLSLALYYILLSINTAPLTLLKIIHVILSWSAFISWTLLVCDLLLIGWLAFRAYEDGENLISIHKTLFPSSISLCSLSCNIFHSNIYIQNTI